MIPRYDLDKIKFATDAPTFEKAVAIYESGGVKNYEDEGFGYLAKVRGSKGNFYKVFVSARHYDKGSCNCYLGQDETLCKHMVALAIYAVQRGEPLTDEDRRQVAQAVCSGQLGELNKEEMSVVKEEISTAMKYIKSYSGPSKIWFSYQDSLSEGCARLSKIISELPVNEKTAKLLVDTLLRLDKKISYGVDDSDGTVGGFIEEVVLTLMEYAKFDKSCVITFKILAGRETMFGWEEPLVKLFNEAGKH